jgi:hypothetical protein
MYSPGKAFVVYEMRRHVYDPVSIIVALDRGCRLTLPTAPSPVTTHWISISAPLAVSAMYPPSMIELPDPSPCARVEQKTIKVGYQVVSFRGIKLGGRSSGKEGGKGEWRPRKK